MSHILIYVQKVQNLGSRIRNLTHMENKGYDRNSKVGRLNSTGVPLTIPLADEKPATVSRTY
jgi:hypothetical protein